MRITILSLLTGALVALAGVGLAQADAPTTRLAGESRFDTAVEISIAQFPDGADTVYLGRAFDPLVDALAGGALTDGPILLVPACGDIPVAVTDEIDRLDPDDVIALGGPGAICDQVLADAATGRSPGRLAGDSRFGTAVAISTAQFPNGATTAYLARATSPLVDALAGGSLVDGPILLVPNCGAVPQEVLDEVVRLAPQRVVALGGEGAVCAQVLTDTAQGRSTGRIAGESRFDTAVEISKARFLDGADTVYLARAFDPLVDALAGGVLTDGPILLVPPCGDIPAAVTAEINRLNPDRIVALGGVGAICQELLDRAGDDAPDPGAGPGPEPDPQRDALVDFYDALDGPNWTTSTGWDDTEDECTWHGVTCTDGVVTGLTLKANGLAGDVPSSFGTLTGIEKLGLRSNAITSLPASIGQLTSLTNLGIRNNQLSSLPAEVGTLPALDNLNVRSNQLTGDITNWTQGLADNDMNDLNIDDQAGGNDCVFVTDAATEAFLDQIDPAWDRCDARQVERDALTDLYNATGGPGWALSMDWLDPDVDHCDWYGITCDDTRRFGGDGMVKAIDLFFNDAAGPIPTSFGDLVHVTDLNLGANDFTSLPASIGNLTGLTRLNLNGSPIGDPPAELGQLPLVTLALGGTGLTDLPSTFDGRTSLRELSLANNPLGGVFPTEILSMTSLEELGLGSTGMTTLPAGLGDLPIERLFVADNPFARDLSGWAAGLVDTLTALTIGSEGGDDCYGTDDDTALAAALTALAPTWDDCIDRDALRDLYDQTGGPTTWNPANWNDTDLHCDWLGVVCDIVTGKVEILDLFSRGLAGAVPSSIADITTLERLGLSANAITSLPPEIGSLPLTNLGIRDNQLIELPDQVGDIDTLVNMNARGNQLFGDISGWVDGLADNGMFQLHLSDGDGGNDCLTTSPGTQAFLDGIAGNWDRCGLTRDAERGGLVDLFNSAAGILWTDSTGWDTGDDQCTWFGVTCDAFDDHVVGLRLPSNGLQGVVPPTIADLQELVTLELTDNLLTEVDTNIGLLTNLEELRLDLNRLSDVPDEVGDLTSLATLILGGNELLDIPASFGQLTSLLALDLQANLLGGDQSHWVAGLEAAGTLVDLALHRSDGNDCMTVGGDATLEGFLDGLDAGWDTCNERDALVTFYNALDGPNWVNTLAGTDPWNTPADHCTWFGVECGGNGRVQALDLESNALAGAVPADIDAFPLVVRLSLFDNAITFIPSTVGSLTRLGVLYLDGNQLTAVPVELAAATALFELWLNNNAITFVPAEIGSLPLLDNLYLQANALDGDVSGLVQNARDFADPANFLLNGQTGCLVVDSALNAYISAKDPNWDDGCPP